MLPAKPCAHAAQVASLLTRPIRHPNKLAVYLDAVSSR